MARAKKQHIIVDGWNLIHFDPSLRRVLECESQAAATQGLLARLEAFCLYEGRRLSIVYDGSGEEISIVRPTASPDLSEIYTPSSMTADELIESLCATSKKASNITVVTADRLLALTASSFGATALAPEVLFSSADSSARSMRAKLERGNFLNSRNWARIGAFDELDTLRLEIEGACARQPLMSKRMKKKLKRSEKAIEQSKKETKVTEEKLSVNFQKNSALKKSLVQKSAKLISAKSETKKPFSYKLGMRPPTEKALDELKRKFAKNTEKPKTKNRSTSHK